MKHLNASRDSTWNRGMRVVGTQEKGENDRSGTVGNTLSEKHNWTIHALNSALQSEPCFQIFNMMNAKCLTISYNNVLHLKKCCDANEGCNHVRVGSWEHRGFFFPSPWLNKIRIRIFFF